MNDNDWLDIPLDELKDYQAHPNGLIRNKKTKKIRNTKCNKHRYISLSFGNFTIALHKIIALTFIINDDPINKTQVDHIDNNKKNNNKNNLKWITASDNVKKAVNIGRKDGRSGTTPIKVFFPDGTTKNYQYQIEAEKELKLKNNNIIKQSINDRDGYYYGSKNGPNKLKEWIYKFEYITTNINKDIIKKDIILEGYEHLIACSNGIIINKNNGKEITGSNDGRYYRIKCSQKFIKDKDKDNYNSSIYKHRLIALTFLPNPENKPYVNHINGITTDNNVNNLEWCNQSENINHAVQNNLIIHKKISEPHDSNKHNEPNTLYHYSEPVLQLELNGNIINEYLNIENAIENLKNQNIKNTCIDYKKKIYNKTSSGYGWCYKKDYIGQYFNKKIKEIFPELTEEHTIDYNHIRKYLINLTKPIIQLDLDGSIVKTYDSVSIASEQLDTCITSINLSIHKNNRLCKGYKFKYMTYSESINPLINYKKETLEHVRFQLNIPINKNLKSEFCEILRENININGELKLTMPIAELNNDGTIKKIWSGQTKIEKELKLPRNTIYRYIHTNNKNWRYLTPEEISE